MTSLLPATLRWALAHELRIPALNQTWVWAEPRCARSWHGARGSSTQNRACPLHPESNKDTTGNPRSGWKTSRLAQGQRVGHTVNAQKCSCQGHKPREKGKSPMQAEDSGSWGMDPWKAPIALYHPWFRLIPLIDFQNHFNLLVCISVSLTLSYISSAFCKDGHFD